MRRSSKLLNVFAIFLLSILVLSVLGADVASARWRNYSFVNYSGRTIKRLYITGSSSGNWGDDILGSSVLSNGDSVSLRYNDSVRYFDIKVVFMDDDYLTYWRYDYRSVWRVTLFRKDYDTYSVRSN